MITILHHEMAPYRGVRDSIRQGRATLRPRITRGAQPNGALQGRGGRVQKHSTRSRGKRRNVETHSHDEAVVSSGDARGSPSPASLPGLEKLHRVLRIKSTIHACSDLSLEFANQVDLETDQDTNTIALNLMEYFLFSSDNWLPELSYCNLHAACFLVASLVTGKRNTIEQIAESLAPESDFIQLVASPLVEDEESAAVVPYLLSVDTTDIENGYALLYERKTQLAGLMGEYASNLANLPLPGPLVEGGETLAAVNEEENFDLFEEETDANQ